MARLPDEQWAMIEDSIEKKRTAASAFKQRRHCGKSGRVRFPHDNMTKKELNAMNGECVAYRMNDPMTWEEFEKMPDDLKADYIISLRKKFGAPDKYVAEMMCVSQSRFGLYLTDLKLDTKIEKGGWDKEGFLSWMLGVKTPENAKEDEKMVENVNENIPEKPLQFWNPMSWEEFKMLSDENKIDYVRWIRDSFKAPDNAIAKMLGCSQHTVSVHLRKLNFSAPPSNGKAKWDQEGFAAWASNKTEPKSDYIVEADLSNPDGGLKLVPADKPIAEFDAMPVAKPVAVAEEVVPVEPVKPATSVVTPNKPIVMPVEPVYATPTFGDLSFDCYAEAALNTLKYLLGNSRVKLHVQWDVVVDEK